MPPVTQKGLKASVYRYWSTENLHKHMKLIEAELIIRKRLASPGSDIFRTVPLFQSNAHAELTERCREAAAAMVASGPAVLIDFRHIAFG